MFPDLKSSDIHPVLQMPFKVIETETEWISVSDGTRLAARVWRPEVDPAIKVPAVIEIIPYRRRDGTLPVDERIHPYWAGNGIAAIRVDLRGCGDSQGFLMDEYLAIEQNDAVDVIDWVSRQPWCNGNVGMTGLSWGGFASLQVAARNPAPLKAIIAVGATVDRYNDDIHYKNGCMLNENFGWGSSLTAFTTRPPDPEVVGKNWEEIWLQRLENLPFFAEKWIENQTYNDYWKHGSVKEEYQNIKVPVMIVGGLNDLYVNALPGLLENLSGACHAVCGPWAHNFPHLATPGPTYDYLADTLQWWQKWLGEPPVKEFGHKTQLVFLKESAAPTPNATNLPGFWIRQENWPPASCHSTALYLGDGTLSATSTTCTDFKIHSPVSTGALAGEWIPHCSGVEIAGDQHAIDAQSTCFDGAPLNEAFDILGRPALTISLSSSAPTGHLIARLCDVAPDGSSELVSIGVINLCHRNGNVSPAAMPINKVQKIEVPLDYTAHRFVPNHRLRVALSTAYWPLIWPAVDNPALSLSGGASVLTLPQKKMVESEKVLVDPPTAPPKPNMTENRASKSQRHVHRDLANGKTIVEIVDDLGEQIYDDHGLSTSATKSERYEIEDGDTLSAQAHISWNFKYQRGKWLAETKTETQMSCDQDNYFIAAKVSAFKGGKLIFEKSFDRKILRTP